MGYPYIYRMEVILYLITGALVFGFIFRYLFLALFGMLDKDEEPNTTYIDNSTVNYYEDNRQVHQYTLSQSDEPTVDTDEITGLIDKPN
jgi:hypothetical protein